MQIRENLYGPNAAENEASFEQLISDNEQKICNLIFGMTGDYHLAQDLTQEAFLKAFQSLHSFNGQSKFSTWLYRIAVNVTIDHQRKSCVRKEAPVGEIDVKPNQGGTHQDPDKTCQKTAMKEILFKAISELPEQQREVFTLREINGCSTKEVAEILGCSNELVKWRLHKARLSLRKTLQGKNQYKNTGTFSLSPSGLE